MKKDAIMKKEAAISKMTKTWIANDIFDLSNVQGIFMKNLVLFSAGEILSPLSATLTQYIRDLAF